MKLGAAIALLLCCLCATARADSVRLRVQGASLDLARGDGDEWSTDDAGNLTRYDGVGAFDGYQSVWRDGDALTISAGRNSTPDWTYTYASLTVAPGRVTLTLNLRTPIDRPDEQYRLEADDLTRLVLKCPAVLPVLNDLLSSIDPACKWKPDPFALAELREPPSGFTIGARVAAALTDLNSPSWRTREKAVGTLSETDCALWLAARRDSLDLTAAQSAGVSAALTRRDCLTASGLEALRRIVE